MFDFNIPPLKVGTIDSLMALSDELTKHGMLPLTSHHTFRFILSLLLLSPLVMTC
jgi:hypothetical protein